MVVSWWLVQGSNLRLADSESAALPSEATKRHQDNAIGQLLASSLAKFLTESYEVGHRGVGGKC